MILLVRVFVALIALGTLAAQIFVIPGLASQLGSLSGIPWVSIPYAVGGIILGVCLEVCLAATWMLLSMASRDAIFTESAFRWVDAIIWASLVALLLVVVFGAHAALVLQPRLDAQGIIPAVVAAVLAESTFVLLVVVLRELLRSATNLRSELAEVI